MKEQTATLNDHWAAQLIDLLVQQKVDYFCLSPGSRSTPLAIALANHPKARSFVHFDERGTAFHALGYAKATHRPAAIITTSGTAVGNLFPAVMEASLSHTPLIVITADRPPELRDTGANQTVDQVKIFGNYVRFAIDLPPPTSAIANNYLATSIAQSVFISLQAPAGPVHLNCMFREPFFSESPLQISPLPVLNYAACAPYPSEELLIQWAKNLSHYEKGVILLGELPKTIQKSSIIALSNKLGWPILPDIFSGFRTDENLISYYELIFNSITDMPYDAFFIFSYCYVSKTASEWLQKSKRCFQVIGHPLRSDPAHRITDRVLCAPDLFCEALLPWIPQKDQSYFKEWQDHNQKVAEALPHCFEEKQKLSEPSLFFFLPPEIPLFLANSMPVRDASFFLPPKNQGPIFGNRGVSGIDGNIATAIGIAQGLKQPLIAVIGDLAGLHDLNSLAQMKHAKYPVILMIINNQGGGIFSFLPIAKKEDLFEKFVAGAHNFSFEYAAKLFDLPYHLLQTAEELIAFLHRPLQSSCLIEIETDRQENYALHQQLYQTIKQCLHSVSCTVF